MDVITGTIFHTLKITNLTLPASGFFPTRVGVQLTQEDDSAPQYLTSSGMIWKFPEPAQMQGRLVLTDRTGYGPRPFIGEQDNPLVFRLQFGATMLNPGQDGLAAYFDITLPIGYKSCKVVQSGRPDASLDVFQIDQNADGYPDNRYGSLSIGAFDGAWSSVGQRTCRYQLSKYNRIYHRQVVYVQVRVNNPDNILLKDDARNIWQMRLSSPGATDAGLLLGNLSTPYYNFLANDQVPNLPAGYGLWSGNAAVIVPFFNDIVQPGPGPSSFARSCCGPTLYPRRSEQWLRVFFKPNIPVDPEGSVILDAPDGFDFGADCQLRDLPDDYYAFYGEFEPLLNRLTQNATCKGVRLRERRVPPNIASTYNSARITIASPLNVSGLNYWGFEAYVTNPTSYNLSQQTGWRLWTEDSMAQSLEGSKETMQFNTRQSLNGSKSLPFYDFSWGLYNEPASDIQVSIESLEPNRISTMSIYSMKVARGLRNTSVRVTAPLGYAWSNDLSQFHATMNCGVNLLQPCEDASRAFGTLPHIDPAVQNELVWAQVSFDPNVEYGFDHAVHLPWHSPRTSSNAFFVEVGFMESEISKRMWAAAIEAPRVATTTTTTTTTTTLSTTTSTTTETTTETSTRTTTTTTTMPRVPVCDVQFLNVTVGWAVTGTVEAQSPAAGGMLVRTQNTAKAWVEETPGDARFFALHFVDGLVGWAVGASGAIWWTQDSGVTWGQQVSGTGANLLGLHFVTVGLERKEAGLGGRQQKDKVVAGWAVGEGGTVLKYQDPGGWMQQVTGTSKTLAGVYFVDALQGWVVGDLGTVLRSEDGGLTWAAQVSGTLEFLYRVHFDDPANGWLAGGVGLVLRSSDGGTTWSSWA